MYVLLGHLTDTRCWVHVRLIQRVQNRDRSAVRAPIVHLVRDVVEVEEVVHEVAGHTQLGIPSQRIAHRGEVASL